jgi:hypothetical protein
LRHRDYRRYQGWALVRNSCNRSIRVNNASQSRKPGAHLTPESIGLLTLVKGYLDELAGQYPEIKSEAGYQSAYPIISNIGAGLVSSLPVSLLPEPVRAVMTALPQNLQQLSTSLLKIADHFGHERHDVFRDTGTRVYRCVPDGTIEIAVHQVKHRPPVA